jgi:hypothetical protein
VARSIVFASVSPTADPAEAAAIVAALEQLARERLAALGAAGIERHGEWSERALLEGIRESGAEARDPWMAAPG